MQLRSYKWFGYILSGVIICLRKIYKVYPIAKVCLSKKKGTHRQTHQAILPL